MSTLAVETSAAGSIAALAQPAVRGIGWPQVRAAVLLGLAITAWTFMVWLQATVDIAQTMPLGRWLLGFLIANQIRALCLMVAIVRRRRG